MLAPTIFLLGLTLASAVTLIAMIRYRHIERMHRIEHGMEEPDPRASFSVVRNMGRFMIALALSLPFSFVMSKLFYLPDYVLIPGSLLLFGGLSLLYSYHRDTENIKA